MLELTSRPHNQAPAPVPSSTPPQLPVGERERVNSDTVQSTRGHRGNKSTVEPRNVDLKKVSCLERCPD